MKISRSNVSRSARHVKSIAAVLAAALLAASSWLILRADVPQVASGTWAPAGDVGAIPNGAASVVLPDGRVLVAGGTIAGALSNGVATYDPAAGAWASGGALVVARSGHAAALLKDGRVLFAGGTASEGPSFDIEIYDPGDRRIRARGRHDLGPRRPRRRDPQRRPRAHRRRLRRPVAAEPCGDFRSRRPGRAPASPRPCRPPGSRPLPRHCSTGTCWWQAATTARRTSRRPKSSMRRPARSSRRAPCRPRAAVTWRCCCRTTTRC